MAVDVLSVRVIPCLEDNYGFLVHEPTSGQTATVDTPDPAAILSAAEAEGWRITQIWNTHHHADHAGGNLILKEATGARVFAAEADRHRIPGVDVGLKDGDIVSLGEVDAHVIATPGHTTGHIAYHAPSAGIAFVGDTLFAMGCGRLFEGAPAQMWDSLSRLSGLPPETTVYCAHEYTQANAKFALSVDPDNPALIARATEVNAARARGEPTIPTTIAAERATNPFLRAGDTNVRAHLGMDTAAEVDVFAEIRRRKDSF